MAMNIIVNMISLLHVTRDNHLGGQLEKDLMHFLLNHVNFCWPRLIR